MGKGNLRFIKHLVIWFSLYYGKSKEH